MIYQAIFNITSDHVLQRYQPHIDPELSIYFLLIWNRRAVYHEQLSSNHIILPRRHLKLQLDPERVREEMKAMSYLNMTQDALRNSCSVYFLAGKIHFKYQPGMETHRNIGF
ncbi:hypothetical protein TNCT_170841 [Trichonephila clavata]|uniref:Uncharacterized protein n=1 Tax=Trichonephila clavata TaxID=2740835 RepID=A0A8X6HKU3_TRICU|nr:hypothetical protein TNCT_170841 [Trichonephila clavata]